MPAEGARVAPAPGSDRERDGAPRLAADERALPRRPERSTAQRPDGSDGSAKTVREESRVDVGNWAA